MYEPDILNKEEGKELLDIARKTLERLARGEHIAVGDYSEKFREKHGICCTLMKNGEKRGRAVSGLPFPLLTTIDAVVQAVNSAAHDVSTDELGDIMIEISILTEPKYISVKSNIDFLRHIVPGNDGIVLHYGIYESYLLPQDWTKIKEKEAFLERLCEDAGLEKEAWKECQKARILCRILKD
ncbi:AMMECR1 domain-containing protein [archaeon]|nr:AMMECR1 domain-containing protein [archaeon]